MTIGRLTVQNIRRLEAVDIRLSPRLNVFYGANASGKTSVFEAIHWLSTGRSFRTARFRDCLSHGAEQAIITARVTGSDGQERLLGMQRDRQNTLMKVAGERVHRVTDMARWLPLQLIHPDSHFLLTAGPGHRRQFLNWGVFHVEPRFYTAWLRYRRALQQRNSALKQKDRRMDGAWDAELSQAASAIHNQREVYIDALRKKLPPFIAAIMGEQAIELHYQPGWDVSQTLAETLRDQRDRDRYRGFTAYGPHRADLMVKVNGYRAQAEISRGQQKMLVSALRLAQAALFQEHSQTPCVIMIDDLPAELDGHHRRALMQLLAEMGAQVLVSCVEPEMIPLEGWGEHIVFHVEHGKIEAVV